MQNYKQLECEFFKILLKQVRDHLSIFFLICMTVPLKAFSIKPYQRPSGTMTAWYYEIISKHFKVGQSQKCI